MKGQFESKQEAHEAIEHAWFALHEVVQHAADGRTRAAARDAIAALDRVVDHAEDQQAANQAAPP